MIIGGAVVLTVNASDTILDPGYVRIQGGRIIEVGAVPLRPVEGEEVVDGSGHVVMPGLVNTHTHLFQTLLRSLYEDQPLPDYLQHVYRVGLALSTRESEFAATLGALEAVRSGVTTVVDHHFLNKEPGLAEATIIGIRRVGLRAVVARTVMDMGEGIPKALLESPSRALEDVAHLLKTHALERANGDVVIMTGPNTPGVNAGPGSILATRDFAQQWGIRRSAHVAEYHGAVDAVRSRYGAAGVVQWLDSLGVLGPDLLAVHAVHVDPDDAARFREYGVSVSHNPISNLFCGDKIAPIWDYVRNGVVVGLGTDGAANNGAQTLIDVMRLTRLLTRADHESGPVSPMKVVRMATIDGARAIGMENEIGSLEAGKRADMILLELARAPHSTPVHNALLHVTHSAKCTDVRSVLVGGSWVMRDRVVQTLDEGRHLQDGQGVAGNLVARVS